MLTNGRLSTLGQVKNQKMIDFRVLDYYVPGEIIPGAEVFSIPEDIGDVVTIPQEIIKSLMHPIFIKETLGKMLPKYQTGQSFRQRAKERNLRKLLIEPDFAETPTAFVDGVPGFGEIPLGETNPGVGQAADATTRGDTWGELTSALTDISKMFFEVKKAPYEAQIEQRQAQIQAQQAAILPSGSVLPYLLIGGAILFIIGGRGKKK